IKQAVSLYKIDLIIMGTNGATGAKEVLFGSNTLNVIRNVDCPVLAIPENFSFEKMKYSLFSLHHGSVVNKEKLEPFFNLIEKHDETHIHILDIDDDSIADANPLENRNLQDSFKGKQHTFHAITG
ncbi:MAG TPA: universal stress protein, partial [Flavobacteriaceae bacterium]|nr:universal stress protein [Flavobacteriaceae bacterium]